MSGVLTRAKSIFFRDSNVRSLPVLAASMKKSIATALIRASDEW
jgi:hypothetical protein